MQFDNSWNALLRPGEATHYFDLPNPAPMQVNLPGYHKINAWWLAELSRLIYRQETDEIGNRATPPTRCEILTQVHLRETIFFNRAGTQGALVETEEGGQPSFAVLVFRGTHEFRDWLSNLNVLQVPWPEGGKVHRGFKEALHQVWEEIENQLSLLNKPVFYTGHSLGAALATLAASKIPPKALYTFGSPRVGDARFATTFKEVPVYRIVNNRDIVTTVPTQHRLLEYSHVGHLHYITHNNQMRVNPDSSIVPLDRSKKDDMLFNTANYRRRFLDPPEFFADHSPVNYVAHLERHL